ncbi:Hypothetical predicted protein [Lecanosticta acicola]|uniref:Uncharacterized protein n=1 Tax=Lecanosticta acicola TaxID=111012 RepID=A0AAI8Z4Q3_9PEZI|nr:Hypothetical predicted protein [Lecanosticta acicola]
MSDVQAAEKIVSEGGPPETSPANAPENNTVSPAEAHASSEGGPTAPAVAERNAPHPDPNKMENRLEANKADKTGPKKDTEVAGRKEKGVLGGGFFKKLFSKKEKKAESS